MPPGATFEVAAAAAGGESDSFPAPPPSLNLTHAVRPRSHATCLLSHTAQTHTAAPTDTVVLTRIQNQTGNQKQQNNPWKTAACGLSYGSTSVDVRSTTWTREGSPFLGSLNIFQNEALPSQGGPALQGRSAAKNTKQQTETLETKHNLEALEPALKQNI